MCAGCELPKIGKVQILCDKEAILGSRGGPNARVGGRGETLAFGRIDVVAARSERVGNLMGPVLVEFDLHD